MGIEPRPMEWRCDIIIATAWHHYVFNDDALFLWKHIELIAENKNKKWPEPTLEN